jgi:hypothetical protein
MKQRVALLGVMLATVMVVLADGSTAVLTLSGTVSRVVALTVTPANNYSSLDLTGGESDKVVGLLNERSNNKAGYTVILTSAGAGSTSQPLLKPLSAGNSDSIPYVLKYSGAPVVLNNGSAILTSASGRTASSGSLKLLAVTIAPARGIAADSYSDSLTLTIQAN